ncbi:MAG: glycosyltransferase family 2 protein [Methanopyri archaeon]|nr:glycosyltransferase family 2 protein [Methanopyri archaeon]
MKVTCLIPAKNEPLDAVKKPLNSILRQEGVDIDRVILAAGTKEDQRRFEREFENDPNVEVVYADGRVKGETVNNAIRSCGVKEGKVLLIDAGDELGSEDHLRRLLGSGSKLAFGRITYRGENTVGFLVGLQFDVICDGIPVWGKLVGSAPVFTTGLLADAEFLFEEGLPENLAEDVTLGISRKWKELDVEYVEDVEVIMEDPPDLPTNFLQQSRWWAGFYQAAFEALRSRNPPGVAYATFVIGSMLASILTTYILPPILSPWVILISLFGRLIYSVLAARHAARRRGKAWALASVPLSFAWTFVSEMAAVNGVVWLLTRGTEWYKTDRG